jgi:hypothetical protein
MCLTPKRLSGVAQEVLFRFPNANASRTGKESQIALLLRTLTQMLYLREKVRGIHLQPSYGGCRTDANFIIPTALPHSPTIGRSILTSELCVTLALLSFTTRLEVLALDTSPAAWRNLFDPSWHSPDGQGFTQVGRAQIVQALPESRPLSCFPGFQNLCELRLNRGQGQLNACKLDWDWCRLPNLKSLVVECESVLDAANSYGLSGIEYLEIPRCSTEVVIKGTYEQKILLRMVERMPYLKSL